MVEDDILPGVADDVIVDWVASTGVDGAVLSDVDLGPMLVFAASVVPLVGSVDNATLAVVSRVAGELGGAAVLEVDSDVVSELDGAKDVVV